MSHEIRTPMNGDPRHVGPTCWQSDSNDTERHRRPVRNDHQANSAEVHCSKIINDILDFSKIDAGRLDLEIIEFDLRTALEGMNDVLAWKPQDKGLEYTCLIDADVPAFLQGDPGRLRQIITNLVDNASKFTAHGEVAFRVSLLADTETEATLRFSIKDTGTGIAPDRLPTLFAPFVQADGSITRKHGGTGLGLTISKSLTEMMGGEIGAESEEGKGSTFWFTAVFPKLDALRHPEIPREKALAALVDRGCILIIDDNDTNRLVLKRQLRAWGLRYDEAEDGEAGWDKLVQAVEDGEPFVMAIIDMQMPKIDGENLGRRIKADARLADTILVMMTSVGRRGDASRLIEAGFAAYLTKPGGEISLPTQTFVSNFTPSVTICSIRRSRMYFSSLKSGMP